MVFLPLLGMAAFAPRAILTAGAGDWGFLYYIWFLIAGFIVVSSAPLQNRIIRYRFLSLLSGLALSTVFLYLRFNPPAGTVHSWVHTTAYFFSTWCWLFAILGFSMRFLAFDGGPRLAKINEGVLPFYILHQPVLVCIGYVVMGADLPDGVKWFVTMALSLAVIMTMYIFIVRRFDLFRFLFGMKTSRTFFSVFRTKAAVACFSGLYAGLIIVAVVASARMRTPMPLTFDQKRDIVLDSRQITRRASTGVQVVDDDEAAAGRSIQFTEGANKQAMPQPQVFVEMQFDAPAGRYALWLRGRCDLDDWADSVWVQMDRNIGTPKGGFRMGNWREVHPAETYGWAGDGDRPVFIELKQGGTHTLRIQPRQVPHSIDQIWLSRVQRRIPDSRRAIEN